MTHNPQSPSPLFTQVDITAAAPVSPARGGQAADEQVGLLRNILSAQDRQNELLEEANPDLARACRTAAESLSRVQVEFLHSITREINENFDSLMDGEFMLNEFVDRFGPRMAHLNGLLQVLAQLSSTPAPGNN